MIGVEDGEQCTAVRVISQRATKPVVSSRRRQLSNEALLLSPMAAAALAGVGRAQSVGKTVRVRGSGDQRS